MSRARSQSTELLGWLNGFPSKSRPNLSCIRMDWFLSYVQKLSSREELVIHLESEVAPITDSLEIFYSVCTLLGHFVIECNKLSDFKTMRKIYRLGSNLSFNKTPCTMKCRQLYFKHQPWSSMLFWVDSAVAAIRNDMERLEILKYGETARMDFIHIQTLLAICRVQSFVSSLFAVGQNKDDVEVFLFDITGRLRLKNCRLDIHSTPVKCFTYDVVTTAISLLVPNTTVQQSSSAVDSRNAGHSPLVELLFRILNSSSPANTRLKQRQESKYNEEEANNNGTFVKIVRKDPPAAPSLCVCNSAIDKWRLVGGYSAFDAIPQNNKHSQQNSNSNSNSNSICNILCERCYRILCADALTVEGDSIYCPGICPSMHEGGQGVDGADGVGYALDHSTAAGVVGNHLRDVTFEYIFNANSDATMIRASSKPDFKLFQTVLEEIQQQKDENEHKAADTYSSPSTADRRPANINTNTNSSAAGPHHRAMKSLAPTFTMDEGDVSTPVASHEKAPKSSDTPGSGAKSEARGLSKFVAAMWVGITVKVIYSGKPVVEKVRLLYMRSDDHSVNSTLSELVTSTDVAHRKRMLKMVCAQPGMFLCWGHRSDKDRLSYQVDKAISLDSVKHIKVGSNKWKSCINVAGESKTLVLKIEEEALFTEVLEGLLEVVAARNLHAAEGKSTER